MYQALYHSLPWTKAGGIVLLSAYKYGNWYWERFHHLPKVTSLIDGSLNSDQWSLCSFPKWPSLTSTYPPEEGQASHCRSQSVWIWTCLMSSLVTSGKYCPCCIYFLISKMWIITEPTSWGVERVKLVIILEVLRFVPDTLEVLIACIIIAVFTSTFQANQPYWPFPKHSLVFDLCLCSQFSTLGVLAPCLHTTDSTANIYWWGWWNTSSSFSRSHSLPYCSWSLPCSYTTCNSFIFFILSGFRVGCVPAYFLTKPKACWGQRLSSVEDTARTMPESPCLIAGLPRYYTVHYLTSLYCSFSSVKWTW